MMLIHKICMAFRGLGNRSNVETAIKDKAAILLRTESKTFKCMCTHTHTEIW